MFQVVKRDGEIAEFQMSKITAAIDKAFYAKEKVYSKDDRSDGTPCDRRFSE